MFLCYYCIRCIFYWYFTRYCKDAFTVWWDVS